MAHFYGNTSRVALVRTLKVLIPCAEQLFAEYLADRLTVHVHLYGYSFSSGSGSTVVFHECFDLGEAPLFYCEISYRDGSVIYQSSYHDTWEEVREEVLSAAPEAIRRKIGLSRLP